MIVLPPDTCHLTPDTFPAPCHDFCDAKTARMILSGGFFPLRAGIPPKTLEPVSSLKLALFLTPVA
jgi:hypothetical protein